MRDDPDYYFSALRLARSIPSAETLRQRMTETRPAEGYVLDPDSRSRTVEVRPDDAQTITILNTPTQTLTVRKTITGTTRPVQGAEFQVLTSSGQYVPDRGGRLSSNGLYSTDSNGEILITGLDPVTLVVKETRAPEGYQLDDTPQTVDILADEMQTLTFRDVPLERVIIRKYEEGTTNPLVGVRFQVTDGGNRLLGAGEYGLCHKVVDIIAELWYN